LAHRLLYRVPVPAFFTSDNVYFCYHFAFCAGYYSCTICLMVSTLRQSQTCHTMKPVKIYDKLKIICKHLVHGRQEDAHEFLRWVKVKLCHPFSILFLLKEGGRLRIPNVFCFVYIYGRKGSEFTKIILHNFVRNNELSTGTVVNYQL
jgi:hypothetical protein